MHRFIVLSFICGSLLAFSADYDRAVDLYNKTEYTASLQHLLALEQKHPAELALIGQNYFMMGDAKRASDFFQKAVAAEPDNSVYYHWLGRAYGRRAEMGNPFTALGHASKTRQNFEKAVELDPKNSEAVNDLFEFYLEAPAFVGGGLDKAAKLAEHITELNPSEGDYARARIDEKRNEYGSAEEHLRHAMKLAPHQVGRVIDLAKFLAKRAASKKVIRRSWPPKNSLQIPPKCSTPAPPHTSRVAAIWRWPASCWKNIWPHR